MSDYKPLRGSSAPAHSLLNPAFPYRSAAATDVAETFRRVRLREAMAREAASPSNVKPLPKRGKA